MWTDDTNKIKPLIEKQKVLQANYIENQAISIADNIIKFLQKHKDTILKLLGSSTGQISSDDICTYLENNKLIDIGDDNWNTTTATKFESEIADSIHKIIKKTLGIECWVEIKYNWDLRKYGEYEVTFILCI